MFNKKLFGYSISLSRALPEDEHRILLGRKFYVHRKDLTDRIINTREGKIHLVLEQIKSKQPEGLSNEELRKYFDREIRKKGFKEVEFPSLMGVEADHSYLYLSHK